MRVAINGFGRIGRAAAKIALDRSDIELVAVNDLGDVNTLAHLLKYDSCYGIYPHHVWVDGGDFGVDDRRIKFLSEKDPSKLPWGDMGVDVVIESTGIFLDKEKAQAHIDGGARKVVLSAPPKDDTPMYVIGVNADHYQGETIVSNASCTTNCITPVMKVLEDNLGIEKSLMTTVHSYTADQNLVDGPHKDLRRARAGAYNITPTTTGAAKAAYKTIPALEGKFDGLAIRVPTPVVSLSDITAVVKRETSIEEINKLFTDAANGALNGILEASNEELVSTDIKANPRSSIVDLSLTQVVEGNLIKVIAWYDNEWGYSNRLVDLAQRIA